MELRVFVLGIVHNSGNETKDGLTGCGQMIYVICQVSESETVAEEKMQLHVVFLLVVLGCSWARGRTVSKCELRDELRRAISNLPQQAKESGVGGGNFVAKSKYWLLHLALMLKSVWF